MSGNRRFADGRCSAWPAAGTQDAGSARITVDASGEAGLRLRTLAGRTLDFPASGPRKVREVLLLDGLNPLASVVLDGTLDPAEAAALDALPPCKGDA